MGCYWVSNCYKDEIRSLMLFENSEFGDTYWPISTLSEMMNLPVEVIEDVLRSYPEEFRKSFIRSEDGEDCYMINSRFAALKDLWASFRHLNYLKYIV